MIQLVEKKLEKLKQVAMNYSKTGVLEQLNKVQAKKFKDVKQLTQWFIKILSSNKQEERLKQQFTKYESQLDEWIEAYKYIETNDSPYYFKIIEMLLQIYDKVEFYNKDPNEVIDSTKIGNSIGMKLIVAYASDPQKKSLVSSVSAKKKEIKAAKLKEQSIKHEFAVPQPVVQTPKADQPKPKPPALHTKKQPEVPITVQPSPRQKQDYLHSLQPKLPPAAQRNIDRPLPRVVRQQVKPRDQRKPMNAILRDLDFASPQDRKETQVLLVQQLNTYMKNMLTRLIELAKIHDSSHNRHGDQFRYFSRQNYHHQFDMPIEARVHKTFYKIREPDKLTIYSQLRNTQQREEEKLRIEDTKKRKEDQKQVMEYVRGEPRNIHQVVFQEEKIQSDVLNIRITTVQALMEMDPHYMDSEMLKKCYIS